jgi:hypothetical protein
MCPSLNPIIKMERAASKSNFIDPGDLKELPLQILVGVGLQVGVPARKSYILSDFYAFLKFQLPGIDKQFCVWYILHLIK